MRPFFECRQVFCIFRETLADGVIHEVHMSPGEEAQLVVPEPGVQGESHRG